MKKLLLTLAVASVALTSSAATRVLYEQNFETVASPADAGWTFGGTSLSIASDDAGKFLELSLGGSNGRSGIVTWGEDIFLKDGVSVLEDGTYTVQFDFCIKQGSNSQYNSCFTLFTNHTPVTNQGYRNPWNPAGWWDNYIFDMSQVDKQPLQFAVNGKTIETTGDDGTVTRAIDYSTPSTFEQNQWYTVTLNVDVNTREVEYSVATFGMGDPVSDASGTITVPENDVNGDPINMFAQGLFVMVARYQTIYDIDNIKVFYESASDYANAPTLALTRLGRTAEGDLNLNLRAYTITFLEGETLHVLGTDGVETAVEYYDPETPGAYVYEATESGTLKAWTTSGEATSEVVETEVDCNPVVLPQATATISSVTAGFGKTYTLNVDNSDVPLRPTIFINYEFTGKSGNKISKEGEASGCKITVDEEGTLKITTQSFGYQENTASVVNDLEFEVKKLYDFARMGDDEITKAGFPAYTVLNSDATSGFNNWTARKRLYYELAGSEHENEEGATVRDFVYPFGFVAADNTTAVINYSVVAHEGESDDSAHKNYFEGLTVFGANHNVGIMKHIGVFNDQTTGGNNKNITVSGLAQSDFVVVNAIDNYGGDSNHPVCATDDEYFKQLAGTDEVFSVAASGVAADDGTYNVVYPLYRIQKAVTKITVFKQAGAQSGLENVVVAEEENTDEGWYTITGLRLEKPTAPGLYIHKGKKVIVK